jgi:hypothetical protein
MLEQPELLKAFKKRNQFDNDVAEKNLKSIKERLSDSLKNINKEVTNIVNFISKNSAASNDKILQDKLAELNLRKKELKDELDFCSEELQKLSNQKPLNSDDYKNILNEFMKKWSDERFEHKETMLKTVIRKVESSVETDNSGAVEVQYIADKKLEAEWSEIKNANSEKIKVRIFGMDGSPGRTQTAVFQCYSFLR